MRSERAVIGHDLILVGDFCLAFVYRFQDCLTDETGQVIAIACQQTPDAWLTLGVGPFFFFF